MISPRPRRALAAASGLLLLFAACSSEADDDPVSGDSATTADGSSDGGSDSEASGELPGGWKRIDGEGVSIGLPEDWEGVPIEEMQVAGEDLHSVLPDVPEEALEQASSIIAQGGVLLAFGPTRDGFTDNVNILELPVRAGVEQMRAEAKLGLETVGAELGELDVVDLGGEDAVRVTYSLAVGGAGPSTTVHGVQFYVPAGRSTFVITLSLTSPDDDLADQMAATFAVG